MILLLIDPASLCSLLFLSSLSRSTRYPCPPVNVPAKLPVLLLPFLLRLRLRGPARCKRLFEISNDVIDVFVAD